MVVGMGVCVSHTTSLTMTSPFHCVDFWQTMGNQNVDLFARFLESERVIDGRMNGQQQRLEQHIFPFLLLYSFPCGLYLWLFWCYRLKISLNTSLHVLIMRQGELLSYNSAQTCALLIVYFFRKLSQSWGSKQYIPQWKPSCICCLSWFIFINNWWNQLLPHKGWSKSI